MNLHPLIEEMARQHEHELRRRTTRPTPRTHRTETADATTAPRPESLALLLRAARVAGARA